MFLLLEGLKHTFAFYNTNVWSWEIFCLGFVNKHLNACDKKYNIFFLHLILLADFVTSFFPCVEFMLNLDIIDILFFLIKFY